LKIGTFLVAKTRENKILDEQAHKLTVAETEQRRVSDL
jgi:hypothetical protein